MAVSQRAHDWRCVKTIPGFSAFICDVADFALLKSFSSSTSKLSPGIISWSGQRTAQGRRLIISFLSA
jgi:hypothetical protein